MFLEGKKKKRKKSTGVSLNVRFLNTESPAWFAGVKGFYNTEGCEPVPLFETVVHSRLSYKATGVDGFMK